MGKLALSVMVKDYDFIAPLIYGDVTPEGIDLTIMRDTDNALDRTMRDPSILVGELSFSRHLLRLAAGDRSWVGVPFFIHRAFRHRTFYVRRDSEIREFTDLVGRPVGVDEWPATGNTWARAAIRERGVRIDSIRWFAGSVDGDPVTRTQGNLPPYVQPAPRALSAMLLAGEIDAIMGPFPPKAFYEPNGPIVRLFRDFRKAEREYYQRTGVYPAFHILGVRRELFDREPWIARSLFQAFEKARIQWQQTRWYLAETTPWILAEKEEAAALMGDWDLNGVEANRKMIQTMCEEQAAQGLVAQAVDSSTVFTEFEGVISGAGVATA